VPPEVAGWSWGGFFLSWIWGLGNNTPLALLALVPCVGVAMPFVLGAKGTEWAWRNKRWESVERFKHVQRQWALAGAITIPTVIALALGLVFAIMVSLKQSEAYGLAVAELRADPRAMAALGAPIEAGLPSGSVSVSGPSGHAELAIAVEGSKAEGTLYMVATKQLGRWVIERAELELDGSEQRIELGGDRQP
jgi:hypothetical protein